MAWLATFKHPPLVKPGSPRLGATWKGQTEDRGGSTQHGFQDFKNNPAGPGHDSESSIGDTALSAPAAVFSGKLKKPKMRGEVPAGRASKNRLHLRMFPGEMLSLSAADGVSGRQVVGARGCVCRCVCVCVHKQASMHGVLLVPSSVKWASGWYAGFYCSSGKKKLETPLGSGQKLEPPTVFLSVCWELGVSLQSAAPALSLLMCYYIPCHALPPQDSAGR